MEKVDKLGSPLVLHCVQLHHVIFYLTGIQLMLKKVLLADSLPQSVKATLKGGC